MKYLPVVVLFALVFLFVIKCEHGLSPDNAEILNGIRGVITYEDNWPPPDSLKEMRVIAFQDFPPGNIFADILSGKAKAFPTDPDENASLSFNVNRQEYFLELDANTTYRYIVVAQRFGSNRFSQDSWRAVGQYDTDTDSLPTAISTEENTVLTDIDIHVDFKHLPIQPF